MWERIRKVETLVTLVAGILTIGSLIAFPDVTSAIINVLTDIVSWLLLPTQVPRFILIAGTVLLVVFVGSVIQNRANSKKIVTQPELHRPTHEINYDNHIVRYYIDSETGSPRVVPPILCPVCRSKLDTLLQYPFDPTSVYVGCSKGHEFGKIALVRGIAMDKIIDGYNQHIADSFVHAWIENMISENDILELHS